MSGGAAVLASDEGARPLALVTRPKEDATRLATALMEAGIDSLISPLMNIETLPGAEPRLEGAAGLLFTSANGVRAFAALTADRALAVYAVGDRTAAMARERGFAQVASASGAIDDLAALVARDRPPSAGRLLHVAGRETAGDLKGRLGALGFDVDRQVLYAAEPVSEMPAAAADALTHRRIDLAPFLSPRTATVFASLVAERGLQPALASVAAVCLSEAVSAALAGLGWRHMVVADEPTQAALVVACVGAAKV